MFKIIGGDGNEYGPVSTEQLRQWIQDGRANAQTRVQAEGSEEWKPLSDLPEFADLLMAPPPFPTGAGTTGGGLPTGDAAQMVQGPAVGLIITAVLGFVGQVAAILMNMLGAGMGAAGMEGPGGEEIPAFANMMSGAAGVIGGIIGIAMSVVILIGALKMKKLESYSFALVATIIAMIPCISPCCLIGLPIGIWALVILNKPEVKSAFH